MHHISALRTNMGAAAARTAKNIVTVVKPHVPLIKFPVRDPAPLLKEVVKSAEGKPVTSDAVTTGATKGSSVVSKESSATILDSSQLPQKYRRKLISKEEMEIIEKGGPV